jgi:hypothetical protein
MTDISGSDQINEKSVDIRYILNKDIKGWYRRELENFYVIIDPQGKILYLSEDCLDFFSVDDIYSLKAQNVSELIGSVNWVFLEGLLRANPENNDFSRLKDKVRDISELGVKWKAAGDQGTEVFILYFKKVPAELSDVSGIKSETQSEKNEEYFKEALGLMSLPVVLVKGDKFFYKNYYFEEFMKEESVYDYQGLKTWIKSYLKVDNYNIEEKEKNFGFQILKDNIRYSISIDYLRSMDDLLMISLNKYVENAEISEVEEIESEDGLELLTGVEEEETVVEKFKRIFSEIKEKADIIFRSLTENDEFDPEAIFKKLNNKFSEYEDIIRKTSKSLHTMSENSEFIDEVSVKIHLISINAAIESARTGEAGKGFSVIAREIAKLSDAIKSYTTTLSKQITETRIYTEKISLREKGKSDETQILLLNLIKTQLELKNTVVEMRNLIVQGVDKLLFKKDLS